MSGMKAAAVTRSRDEVADAIRSFSDADWIRLQKVAKLYARLRPMEPEDLLQEAFRCALDGGRSCPAQVDVVKFLAEAMRSIANGEQEKAKRRPLLESIAQYGEAGMVDPPDPSPGAEQDLGNAQDLAAMRTSLLRLFVDDEIAQLLLEGLMEGMQGAELMELTELDKTAYETKRRLIRRRIDQNFPQGWPS